MKGLLIKDILNLKNYMKQLILVFIFFVAYGIFLKNGTFVGSMTTMMLSMQVITTMSYDEYAKWDKYALTMNINRKDVVLSKYVFFIICIVAGIIIGDIVSLAINSFADVPLSIQEILMISITIPCIFAILFSIVIPIVFKVGVEKARVVMMAVFFIPAILVFAVVKMAQKANIPMPDEATLDMMFKFGLVGVIILTILIVFASYKISLSIYNKKEF
ncbi:ABC-2 transporter permease [Intestinibacter bartlettii]|uniref:ABC-2 transporter permease n=1 Tax=Intestinibacter bartlettii TaxID=261299 RepID=A0ABS6E152_9FIRM|nr:ABC-2 transporter permease [Intestinibacter bartlettii]MBU5337353.1 ABC-2 transporter permease [Intestinibacter bartlettii]